MAYDPYSGDYGPNFLGHALNTGVYLTQDDRFGWLGFGGDVEQHDGTVRISVLDSSRQRVFLAPLGLWLTLDAGQFEAVEYDTTHHVVRLHLAPATAHVSTARLRVQQTGQGTETYPYNHVEGSWKMDGGAYDIPLSRTSTVVSITRQKE